MAKGDIVLITFPFTDLSMDSKIEKLKSIVEDVYECNSVIERKIECFSKTGKLVYDSINSKKYYYDENDKMSYATIKISYSDKHYYNIDDIYVYKYEYTIDGYRIIKTHKSQSAKEPNGESFEKEIEKIVSIEEFKFIDSKLTYYSLMDLSEQKTLINKSKYIKSQLVQEILIENNAQKMIEYEYTNNKLAIKTEYDNENKKRTKIVFLYSNDNLIREEVYSYSKKKNEYLAYYTNYEYNDEGKITMEARYGKIGDFYELHYLTVICYNKNVVIKKYKTPSGSSAEAILGFASLEELKEESEKNEFLYFPGFDYKPKNEDFLNGDPHWQSEEYYEYFSLSIKVNQTIDDKYGAHRFYGDKIVKVIDSNPGSKYDKERVKYFNYLTDDEGRIEIEQILELDKENYLRLLSSKKYTYWENEK